MDLSCLSLCTTASLCLVDSENPSPNEVSWMMLSGLCWTAAYCLYMYTSFRDGHYHGPPALALSMNLAWEFFYSVMWLEKMGAIQLIVNRVWLGFDIVLLVCFGMYGISRKSTGSSGVVWWFAVMQLAAGFGWFITLTLELNDYGGRYTAFTQNALMSGLFVASIINEEEVKLDAQLIPGVLRLIGTLAPSYVFYLRTPGSPYLVFCFVSCLLCDVAYVVWCGVGIWGGKKKRRKGE